jgi:hypothetical protein
MTIRTSKGVSPAFFASSICQDDLNPLNFRFPDMFPRAPILRGGKYNITSRHLHFISFLLPDDTSRKLADYQVQCLIEYMDMSTVQTITHLNSYLLADNHIELSLIKFNSDTRQLIINKLQALFPGQSLTVKQHTIYIPYIQPVAKDQD